MKGRRLAHAVNDDVDLEMAIALEHPVRAACGKRWVPTLVGDEVQGIPECPACFPRPAAKRAPKVTADITLKPNYVYRCYDKTGRLIYVGCTVNPIARLREHRKNAWWGNQIATTRLVVFPGRDYALKKEREAIATEQPRWNVKGRWPYREGWAEQDYLDYLTAIREGAVVIGTYSAKHIAEIQAELEALRTAIGGAA